MKARRGGEEKGWQKGGMEEGEGGQQAISRPGSRRFSEQILQTLKTYSQKNQSSHLVPLSPSGTTFNPNPSKAMGSLPQNLRFPGKSQNQQSHFPY